MTYSILIAGTVPLLFLYIVKWLNFFETHRPKLIYIALAWGAVAFGLSYLVNHPLIPILGRPFVAIRIGPSVEEIFKSLILLYLVRRSDYTYFVDGAIYGFAVGVGFAVAENMLYLSRVDVSTGVIIAITRAFSASVLHGSSTALVGMVIGGFPLGRIVHPLLTLIIGWALAIAYHTTYNDLAFKNYGQMGLIVISGIAFAGLLVVAAAIMWGLRRERRRLRKSLGRNTGVSEGEIGLVQRIEDLDLLLAPVHKRFGESKREQVANVLILAAQLAMKQAQMKRTRDAELRTELAAEVSELKRQLKRQRHEVGMYAMTYARTLVPKTTWSLWVRLGQTLGSMPPTGQNLWRQLDARVAPSAVASESVYVRIGRALAARAQTDAARGGNLPEGIQRFLRWGPRG